MKIFFFVIFVLLVSPKLTSQTKVDSLLFSLKGASDKEKMKTYYQIADEYFNLENFETAIEYYIKSAEQSLKINDTSYYYLIQAYGNAGYTLNKIGKTEEALNYHNLSLKYAILVKDSIEIANAYSNLGMIYITTGNFEKAAHNLENALEIDLETNNKDYLSIDYNALGKLYQLWEKYDLAIEYFRKALAIDNQQLDETKISIRLNSIGMVYFNIEQYDSTIFYLNKALEIDERQGNEKNIAIRLSNLGRVYSKIKAYKKAERYYQKAIGIFEKYNVEYSLCISYSEFAQLWYYQKELAKAEFYSKKSIIIGEKLKLKTILKESYQRLALIYELQGKYADALQNFKKYSVINDSLFSEKSMQTINNLEVKYETEKFENENKHLKNEAEIKDLTLQRRNILLFALVTIALLVIFIAAFLLYRIKSKNKINKLLSDKNHQLEILNATKDKFFSIISHDLKNPISAFKNISQSLSNSIDKIEKDELKYYIDELSNSSSMIYNLLHNLLQWAQTQTGAIKCRPTPIDLSVAVKKTLDLTAFQSNEKGIMITSNIPEKTMVIADNEMLQTVLRNLISNAIKFTPASGKIEISSEFGDDSVLVSIKDNGIGISKEDLSRLFKINEDVKTIGNSPEKGTGLGLIICKEMLERCGGKIFVESDIDRGTCFKFTLSGT